MSKLPFPTECPTDGDAILRISKLECQFGDCEGLDWSHGCFKEVNKERLKELGDSAMFLPELDPPDPINFVCKKCVDSSCIIENSI